MDFSKTAIVFPGQGSQSIGMLGEIAQRFDVVREIFEEASQELKYDLWKLTQEGPQDVLDQTTHTQPALLAASYAIWKILQESQREVPKLLAGHSLGEYTALVCAGCMPFGQAIKLVAARGAFMQEAVAVGTGAMAAIVGLDDHAVATLCKEAVLADEVLSAANYNSIGQVVIAGHKASVENAVQLAKTNGAKLAILILVSVPSHCALMKPAANKLAALLTEISLHPPTIPVINNVDVSAYITTDQIRDGLARQLYCPVRWVETIHYFTDAGIETIIECGPGKILTGLNKRINKSLTLYTTQNLENLEPLLKLEA